MTTCCVEGIKPDQCDHSSTGGQCDVCGVELTQPDLWNLDTAHSAEGD